MTVVYHYTEVNLVRLAVGGGVTLTNNVLPHTNVDYVSYSAYDPLWGAGAYEGLKERMFKALDYVESKLPPKEGIPGKRVYIGEYGFPIRGRDGNARSLQVRAPQEQERSSREFARAALEWGCPFVLYWEMYCNEIRDGVHNGFWIIDDSGGKQPVYHTHRRHYQQAKEYVAEFARREGRPPTAEESQAKAIELLADRVESDSSDAPDD